MWRDEQATLVIMLIWLVMCTRLWLTPFMCVLVAAHALTVKMKELKRFRAIVPAADCASAAAEAAEAATTSATEYIAGVKLELTQFGDPQVSALEITTAMSL